MAKYSDVSLALRNKIRREMEVYEDVYDGDCRGVLIFTEKDVELFQECLQWLEVIASYFKTSYDCYRITKVGRFRGVRPARKEILCEAGGIMEMKVEFDVEEYDPKSWMDWFDVEGKEDGELRGALGTVINKRTTPQYFIDGKYIFAKENN